LSLKNRKFPFTPGDVPCNGCTLCCQWDAVRLDPRHDDISLFQVEPHAHFPGEYMLAHKPDGSCVYLMEGGCSIHGHAPRLCRTMDCRILPLRMGRGKAESFGALAVYKRGLELLEAPSHKRSKKKN